MFQPYTIVAANTATWPNFICFARKPHFYLGNESSGEFASVIIIDARSGSHGGGQTILHFLHEGLKVFQVFGELLFGPAEERGRSLAHHATRGDIM